MTRPHVGRALALARFAVATNLRSWTVRAGAAAGAAVMLLGPVISVRQGRGWNLDGELGTLGFFMIAVFVIRSGLETHRESDLETYLRHNFVSVGERAAAYAASVLAAWLVVALLGVLLVLAAGEPPREAAWLAASWSLRLLVVLAAVPIVEAVLSIRLPLVLPLIAYTGFVIIVSYALPPERADPLLIPVSPGDYDALGRLALQGAALFALGAVGFTGVLAFGALLPRIREVVPFRHGGAP